MLAVQYPLNKFFIPARTHGFEGEGGGGVFGVGFFSLALLRVFVIM